MANFCLCLLVRLAAMKRKGDEKKVEGEPSDKKPKKGRQGKAKSEKEEANPSHNEKPHVELAGERKGREEEEMCWEGRR
jgi:hypothetical protein